MEDLKAWSLELSKELDFPVRIDKVANRFYVSKKVETEIGITEITEQELLASDLTPLQALRDRVRREITPLELPRHLTVPSEFMRPKLRNFEGHVAYDAGTFVQYYNLKDQKLQFNVLVPVITMSSQKKLGIDIQFCVAELVGELRAAPLDSTVIFLETPEGFNKTRWRDTPIRTYVDSEIGCCQAWADVFCLVGHWAYNDIVGLRRIG